MGNLDIKGLKKVALFSLIWIIAVFVLAFIITGVSTYNFDDTLFVLGIIVFLIGVLSNISGEPVGLSMQSLGSINAQQVANANLEVKKLEEEKLKNVKATLKEGFNSYSMVLAGAILIIVNFMM